MRAQSAPVLKHVGIVAIDGVFASTLMQAKDFFHMASLRHGKQQGLGLQPAFRTRILSPDGQPVRSFSGDSIAVDGPSPPAISWSCPPSGAISTRSNGAIRKSFPGCAAAMPRNRPLR